MSEQTTHTTSSVLEHLKALEPYANRETHTFPVMEIFGPTIQGEGAMIGVKTAFVRFGGCDYRCEKCDSMHAVLPHMVKAGAYWLTTTEIAERLHKVMLESNTEWVTLSGGNPAIWDLQDLVDQLHANGAKVAVETQGSIWRDWLGSVDQLTISPKSPGMGERFNPRIFEQFMAKTGNTRLASDNWWCVKVVVFAQRDFEFAKGVDDILDRIGYDWLKTNRFLSLGNDHVPRVEGDHMVDDALVAIKTAGYVFTSVKTYLLWKYKMLLEDYLQDAGLSHWKFLPQLHVLVWDNKAGV